MQSPHCCHLPGMNMFAAQSVARRTTPVFESSRQQSSPKEQWKKRPPCGTFVHKRRCSCSSRGPSVQKAHMSRDSASLQDGNARLVRSRCLLFRPKWKAHCGTFLCVESEPCSSLIFDLWASKRYLGRNGRKTALWHGPDGC